MANLQNRLKNLRKEFNYTQKDMGSLLGITTSAYGFYEQGRTEPTLDILEKLSNIFSVSIDYILGNDDVRLKNEIKIDNVVKLPVLGSVRAGTGGWAIEEVIGHEYAFNLHDDTSDYYYLKVKGDSMEPRISEGDLALVRKQSDVESGDLAIVLINGDEGVIKKVVKKDGRLELHSFNAYYPVRVFSGQALQDVSIIGKVINTTRHW
ncbi:MAG: XRE family transcriptional regulator [Fusobacterium sp.]|nr:XRE family transcriptional regulator [Fusobacterium sp.]